VQSTLFSCGGFVMLVSAADGHQRGLFGEPAAKGIVRMIFAAFHTKSIAQLMPQSGPIIIVEDDKDDQEIIRDILKELKMTNELIFFDKPQVAFDFLKTTVEQPFIILSDINLPEQNGVEFKRQIDEDPQLRAKSIPFIFFSTSADKRAVDTAYKEMTVQGFFQKKSKYDELKSTVKLVMDYWKECRHPNS
jgi:CheY-like chemotaxis protein